MPRPETWRSVSIRKPLLIRFQQYLSSPGRDPRLPRSAGGAVEKLIREEIARQGENFS